METTELEISGYFVIVDVEDVERIELRHWYLNKSQMRKHDKYYFYNDRVINKKKETITLHRYIMGSTKGDGFSVDHIDGNTLNCSKENLRKCSNTENVRNSKVSRVNTSGYKGVQYSKAAGKWQVRILYQQQGIYLGLYEDIIEAAKVYDVAALFYFKEYARTNFPKETYENINLKTFIEEHLPKNTSQYKGVYKDKLGTWIAAIQHNKVYYYLGTHKTEEAAHIAYREKRKELGLDKCG